ncbi:MAG: hypothetical protein ACKOX4_12320, partial [Bacteroidota bacterium]
MHWSPSKIARCVTFCLLWGGILDTRGAASDSSTLVQSSQDSLKNAQKPPAYGGAIELSNPEEEVVEYVPETGLYILRKRIGNTYVGIPRLMNLSEYLAWREN